MLGERRGSSLFQPEADGQPQIAMQPVNEPDPEKTDAEVKPAILAPIEDTIDHMAKILLLSAILLLIFSRLTLP